MTAAEVILQGCLGASHVGSGPTDEQFNILQSLSHAYFGLDLDIRSLSPIGAAELARNVDEQDRHRVVDFLIVLEFCRHPADSGQADLVEEYVDALGIDEPFLLVARDALATEHAKVMEDWSRFSDAPTLEPGLATEDPDLAEQLRSLQHCPPESLGRTFFDYYETWGLKLPGEPGGGSADLVAHDFAHVLAGYVPTPVEEISLQAMLVSATNFEHHFSGLIASLSLFETASFDILDLIPKRETLNRTGATDIFAKAFRRGQECDRDFSTIDHLARANESLRDVRRDLRIPSRSASL